MFTLTEGDLHLWQGTVARHTRYADWAMLSKPEHARWRRLPPVAAAYYAGAHAAVRRILGRYLRTPPVSLRIGQTGGRPVVATPGDPLWFSLSHSGPHWMLAVGRYRIGVDIEAERPVDIEALEELALSDSERRTLAEHDKADRAQLFFRCWTRKEAVLKASGSQFRLATVDVAPSGTSCVARVGDRDWRVESIDVGEGRHAAVASPAEFSGRILHHMWDRS